MTRWVFLCGFLPVLIAPRRGVWHRSLGPVQLISPAAFAEPDRYPVSSVLAICAAIQFYLIAGFWALWLVLAVFVSLAAALVVLLVIVILSPGLCRHWIAARYGMALAVAKADAEVLFWASLLADKTKIDRGRARELLTGWIDWANRHERGRPALGPGFKGNPPPKK